MPVVTPCESSCIAQPPARFKSCADEENKQSIKQQVPVLAPPPRYPKKHSTPRLSGDQQRRRAHTSLGSTGLAGLRGSGQTSSGNSTSALTTSERASSPKQQLSIMELVNQASKQAENEAAAAAAAKRAGHRHSQLEQGTSGSDRPSTIISQLTSSVYNNRVVSSIQSRSVSPRAVPSGAPITPRQSCSTARTAAGTAASIIPCSEAEQQGSSKQQLEQLQPVIASSKAADKQPATDSDSNRIKDASPRAAAGQPHPLPTSAFNQHSNLYVLVSANQSAHSSECGSDDPLVLGSMSSLCSSSSSSSLCSAASCSSNASSTLSAASRPKSILLTRTSTSSTSSSSSSPRFSKRVTWKDGAVVGQELVAVRVLLDTPEMRRIRKDTWPERPGSRMDAEDEAEAAEAAARDQHRQPLQPRQQQQQQQSSAGLVSKLLEPSRLNDWREKLRVLQLERRQQRMELVQAGWTKQQANQARKESQKQQQQQCVDQQAASSADADCTKPGGHRAGPVHISAVASAHMQPAAC